MNNISSKLSNRKKKCALVPFITAGVPCLKSTSTIIKILDEEGADMIEVGVPYSDPLADGPIIQEASKIAISQGTNLKKIFKMLSDITLEIKCPIILFTYYNPILSAGLEVFFERAQEARISGLIIPDLPLEETQYIQYLSQKFQIELILLITPNSHPQRIQEILASSSNTIYVVSRTGITGTRKQMDKKLNLFIENIKSNTDKNIILGFGIATIQQIKITSTFPVDGIVIGSAFIKRLLSDKEQRFTQFRNFCKEAVSNLA